MIHATVRRVRVPVRMHTIWRLAVATVGHLEWELIEPLDNEGTYATFLAEKGGGVHHIAVAAQDFDEMLAGAARRGTALPLSGEFEGVRVAYLGTDGDLGVALEIFSGNRDLEPKPDTAQAA